jgi:type IV pilus assembly protein PilM
MSSLPKHAMGLDISDASIEALEIKKKFGKIVVNAFGRKKLEKGIIVNCHIHEKEKLAKVIKDLLVSAQPKRFSTKNVILSIPESKTFIHVFQLPSVISEENIGESIQYEAEQTIPLSFDQVYHDYQIVTKGKEYQEVLYVACFKDVVDDYREVVNMAGLNPVIFEAESTSLARSLVRDTEGTALIADIGAHTTIVTIYDNYGIRYSHNIAVGGDIFTEKIAEALKVTNKEAERLKRAIGLIKERIKGKEFFNLEPLAQELITAVNKAINYHKKRSGKAVDRVILCGGASLTPGLEDYMRNELPVKVETGNPFSGLRFDKDLFKDQPVILFSTVIGLAWRGLNKEIMKSGLNPLVRKAEQTKFKDSKKFKKEPKKELIKSLKKEAKPATRLTGKRLYILLAVFVVLILLFAGIFFLQQGKEEPLIQFQSYDFPTEPVDY